MAKAQLTLILHLSSDEADALWEMLDISDAFNKPITEKRTVYAEYFDLVDVHEQLGYSSGGCELSLPLTGPQLVKLKRALKACMEYRPAFFMRSPLWDLQAEIEDLPAHLIKE